MVSALSLYDGEEKVSELLSETGFFKQIDGQQQKSFVFTSFAQAYKVLKISKIMFYP
ncbi:hypothetical protein [Arsenophonus sp. ENCA]|uniref:hypothetical protein n=1 Tax=Arsenophonus sp. ENCA TaxID=1987579 RepID=UPI0025C6B116|nr:hypothetical protein [Arsenophonus sp. ENCA]